MTGRDADQVRHQDFMRRLEELVATLPEAERVDVEGWGGEPTFRVRGKVFVFAAPDATTIGVKLSLDEARALIQGDDLVSPMGHGLGRHGWVTVTLRDAQDDDRWQQVTEWVRTSYVLVAPTKLARLVDDQTDTDGADTDGVDTDASGIGG